MPTCYCYVHVSIKLSSCIKCGSSVFREVAAQACQVLGKLLNGMRPIKVYDTYKQQILLGLEHPNCDVKSLCCQQVLIINTIMLLVNCPE